MQSTIALFRELYSKLPPLTPPELKQKMGHALAHLEKDQTITVEEVEDTMIEFGYEVWPWNQAYREFLVESEFKIGEHFLLPKLTAATVRRYNEFKRYGGSLRDLHSGRSADFFTLEERVELRDALIAIQGELRSFTDREVLSVEKAQYLQRVAEFSKVLRSLKEHITHLSGVAQQEQDHPALAGEIRARLKSFEYSLCLLGPELNYKAVEESIEFFRGRRQELNRLSTLSVTPAAFND